MAAGRCYVRNGVWGWSLEEQRKALADAGADLSREFCDELPAVKAKMPGRVQPEWLTERGRLLKPTARTRGETIHVASLLSFAVNETDLVLSLAAAAKRKDTVRAADSGIVCSPTFGPFEVSVAIQDWKRAKLAAQTKPGRRAGNRAAADAARARTLAKLPGARGPWREPDRYTAQEVALICGLSVKTLYTELGRRPMKRKGKSSAKR